MIQPANQQYHDDFEIVEWSNQQYHDHWYSLIVGYTIIYGIYSLVIYDIAMGNGPVEMVDLASYKMVIVHSHVNVYQRVE